MSDRNYPCDNIVDVYFGVQTFDDIGTKVFQRQRTRMGSLL